MICWPCMICSRMFHEVIKQGKKLDPAYKFLIEHTDRQTDTQTHTHKHTHIHTRSAIYMCFSSQKIAIWGKHYDHEYACFGPRNIPDSRNFWSSCKCHFLRSLARNRGTAAPSRRFPGWLEANGTPVQPFVLLLFCGARKKLGEWLTLYRIKKVEKRSMQCDVVYHAEVLIVTWFLFN